MNWQILISLSIIFYSVSILLQRLILREDKSQPIAYSIFFQVLCGIFIGSFGFFFADLSLPENLSSLFLNLLLATFLYGFGNVFIFKSLKQTEASKFTVIFAARAFFTVLASSLILREFLTSKQLVGALLIFFGVILVNLKSTKFSFGKGELLAFLGAMSFGFANTNDRYLLKFFNLYPFITLVYILPAILMSMIYSKELKRARLFLNKKVFSKILLLCVMYSISSITFFAALQISQNSSQVATINLTNVIIIVLLAIAFLQERESLTKKLLGAILSFIGVLLIS